MGLLAPVGWEKKKKRMKIAKVFFFSGTSSWVKRNIKMTHGKFLQTRFKMALMEWKKKREKKFTKFCKSCVSDTGWAKLTEKKEKRRSGSNFAELVLPAPVGWKETAERFSSDCTASHARPWGDGSWLTNLQWIFVNLYFYFILLPSIGLVLDRVPAWL